MISDDRESWATSRGDMPIPERVDVGPTWRRLLLALLFMLFFGVVVAGVLYLRFSPARTLTFGLGGSKGSVRLYVTRLRGISTGAMLHLPEEISCMRHCSSSGWFERVGPVSSEGEMVIRGFWEMGGGRFRFEGETVPYSNGSVVMLDWDSETEGLHLVGAFHMPEFFVEFMETKPVVLGIEYLEARELWREIPRCESELNDDVRDQ